MFSCVTPGAFDELTSLNSLNLIANPFNCNCHMAWFADWLRQKGKCINRQTHIWTVGRQTDRHVDYRHTDSICMYTHSPVTVTWPGSPTGLDKKKMH